jgi:death-on-curing protein
LPLEEVVRINRDAVAATSEPHLLSSPSLLESALGKPINHWSYGEDDIVTLATQLLLGIARNHPFAQGINEPGLPPRSCFSTPTAIS